MSIGRFIVQAIHGAEFVREKEASHLCNNPSCIRASHLLPEFAQTNASGSRCPPNCSHTIKCVRSNPGLLLLLFAFSTLQLLHFRQFVCVVTLRSLLINAFWRC